MMFLTIFLFMLYVLQNIFKKKILMEGRLDKIANVDETGKKERTFIIEKVVKKTFNRLNKYIYGLMPSNIREKIYTKLQRAGLIPKLDVYKWITIKLVVSFVIPLSYLYIIYKQAGLGINNIVSWLVVAGILYALPNLFLEKLINKRKRQIERELPDVLDLLSVSVEAGLSFDNSILKLTEKMKGVVMDEFLKAISEMRMGKTRKESLEAMQKRLQVDDVTTFIGSLIQAYELGISISNVIKIQSKGMRQKRRQRAQEIAMKAPVKMLFPLVFFIFPSIFIILLGPAIIRIMETFGS